MLPNNFHFLRLLLAILVLLSHSPELIDGDRHREILTSIFHTISFGELSVNGFFLLSGYLIVQSWHRSPQIFRFLKNRCLRIYPAFIVATLICGLVIGPLGAGNTDYFIDFKIWPFLQGILLLNVPAIPPVFVGQPYALVNGSMWTIAYEFKCYSIVVILGMLGSIERRKEWLIFSVIVVMLSIFPEITKAQYYQEFSFLLGNLTDLIHFLAFFGVGGCFYLFSDRIRYSRTSIFASLFVLIISLFESHTAQIGLTTIGAYLFFWISFLPVGLIQKYQKMPDLSYGTYLYGWPIQKILIWYFHLRSPWLTFILTCPLSIGCGWLSWHLIEKHFLRFKQY